MSEPTIQGIGFYAQLDEHNLMHLREEISDLAIDHSSGMGQGEPIHIVVDYEGFKHCFTFHVQEDEDTSERVLQYVQYNQERKGA